MDAPPEAIALPSVGAVLRRHRHDDVDAIHAAIELSRDHLRPWMPWADQSRADTEAFLAAAIADWEAGTGHQYVITDASDGAVLGGCGLHVRVGGPATREIGYWRRADAGGRGLVTVAGGTLTAVALALPGVTTVEIRCDEANTASAAVARRLGFTLARIEDDGIKTPGERGRSMIWTTAGARPSSTVEHGRGAHLM